MNNIFSKSHIKSGWLKGIVLIILMLLLALLVALLVNVNSKRLIGHNNCSFANACKVLAYLNGYSDDHNTAGKTDSVKYWFSDYYNYLCDIGLFDKGMIKDSDPDRALMQSDLDYVYKFIGILKESDMKKDKAISNSQFISVVQQYKEHFEKGDKLDVVQLGIVAACGEAESNDDVFNKLYTVSTNKGKYYYTGLNLTGYKDKTIEVFAIEHEILMVTDVISDETTFKNVWISEFKDNKLYVNMYGVNREFYIGGTSEDVSGMLADIVLKNGKMIGITVKKDITDTNIRILIYNNQSDSTAYDSVTVTSDSRFYMKCGDVINEFNPGDELVLNNEMTQEKAVISAESGSQIKLLSINKSQGNPEYEGTITAYKTDGGIVLVNEIAIENYLKRVVPSEMPSSFGVEALKVQAVCARSYAYAHLDGYAYPEYEAHMDDTINYQVYNNTVEKPEANEAISATCGKMLYYADEIVTAYYYSTSCGAGADVSLWGSDSSNYPYYESKLISSDNQGIDLSSEDNFRKFITRQNENDYDYGCNYYRWKIEKSSADIISNIRKMGYSDIGTVNSIKINNRVSGGGVNSVTIKGSKADVCIESEGQIRKAFDLPSSFFIIDTAGKSKDKTFVFTGGGYGHGIGMSQNAVKNMTQRGMDYISILNFFYSGTSVF